MGPSHLILCLVILSLGSVSASLIPKLLAPKTIIGNLAVDPKDGKNFPPGEPKNRKGFPLIDPQDGKDFPQMNLKDGKDSPPPQPKDEKDSPPLMSKISKFLEGNLENKDGISMADSNISLRNDKPRLEMDYNVRYTSPPCGSYYLVPGTSMDIDVGYFYPRYHYCNWDIEGTSSESTMSITCSGVWLRSRRCRRNFLRIRGGNFTVWHCRTYPYSFTRTSDDNQIRVTFWSRPRSRRHDGFYCRVTASALTSSSTSSTTTTSTTSVTTTPSCRCGRRNPITKIVGGIPATLHEYPWQVSLTPISSNQPVCGGSIISDRWIMTAAHCVDRASPGGFYVVIGEHDWTTASETTATQQRLVTNIQIHSSYNSATYDNDIALLELSSPITFPSDNKIAPVCLPTDPNNAYSNVNAIVTGWGTNSSGGYQPDVLHEVTVQTMTNANCQMSYGASSITTNMICASDTGKDSCQGDSGGPMVTASGSYFVEIGIVSWGTGCALPAYPGVYARVGNYLTWINNLISGSGMCPPP